VQATTRDPWGWESFEARADDGAVSSSQRARVAAPVVPMTESGARLLARVYWEEVSATTFGLTRARVRAGGMVVLRLAGRGPALLRFGPAEIAASPQLIVCAHPIAGGALARRPVGEIRFEQHLRSDGALLVSSISGFHPTLAARPGAPAWTGELYGHVQARLHVAVSRRYFARLAREGGS
jgi:hypothetical protein